MTQLRIVMSVPMLSELLNNIKYSIKHPTKKQIMLPTYCENLSEARQKQAKLCETKAEQANDNLLLAKCAQNGNFYFCEFKNTINCQVSLNNKTETCTIVGYNTNKELFVRCAFFTVIIDAGAIEQAPFNYMAYLQGGTTGKQKYVASYFSETTSIEEGLCE